MKLRQYIREMVETELNEMAAIATLEKIKSPEKLEKFKKLYTGNENSLVSKLIDTIEKGSVKIVDAEKAASNPKAQEVIEFINAFNSKPGFKDHPIPVSVLTKEFGSIDDLISDKILSKIEGVTRNGMLVATNKSHTAGISPTLRQLSDAGILSNPKEEGEYIVPKKEKPESTGIKGRPTSEKVLMAKALNSKFEADSNYKPNEEELAMFADEPGFIEKLRMRVMGTLKRGPKNALKNAMKGLETLGDDVDGDGDVDNEDLKENESNDGNVLSKEEWERYYEEYNQNGLNWLLRQLDVLDGEEERTEYAWDYPVEKIESEFGIERKAAEIVHQIFAILKEPYGQPNFKTQLELTKKLFQWATPKELVNKNPEAWDSMAWADNYEEYLESVDGGDLNENESTTLDTNKLKSFISRIKSFGGSKYDKQDFVQIAKLLVGNKLSEAAKMISLLDTSPNEWIFEAMSETYPELWDMLFEDDKSGYVALAKPRTGLSESKKPKKLNQVTKKPLNEEFKRMQKLAGLITENENSEIKMDGDFTYLKMSANNLYEYLKNNFPELASLEKCMTLIEFVEENVAQDREDEDEEMELITISVPEFWDAYDNFYGKF